MTNEVGRWRWQGTARWSPDGRWIAFDSQGDDGRVDVWVIDADGGQLRRVTPFASDESAPSWSRDGKWIYFRSDRTGRNEIWKMPFQGGQAVQVTDKGGYVAFESWDSTTLYYVKAVPTPTPLFARPLGKGPEHQIIDRVVNRAFYPVEDGIYYIGPGEKLGTYSLQFYDFATGRSRALTAIEESVYLGLAVSPDRKTVLFSVSNPATSDLMLIENFR
jgi:Tol biopolymer transport system component